jgi:NAD(P)-binding Rossmann-like domain
MPDALTMAEPLGLDRVAEYDAIVIGAGISGMFMLYRLRQLGMTVRVFEAGSDVGGTWYWNRYPGARFDSESWTYGYSFSKELMREWDWKEHFSPQPDTLEYLNYVADKFDLRRDIQFRSTVASAHSDEGANRWSVTLESGELAMAVPVHRHRHPLGLYAAGDSGPGQFQGPCLSPCTVAAHIGGFHRQARRHHRHRCDRHPGDPGDRQTGEAPHRFSTPSQLGGTLA